jgi:hypothetical protein
MKYKPVTGLRIGLSIALISVAAALAAAASSQLTANQLRAKAHALYETKAMNGSKTGEDKTIVDHGVLIHYMSASERESSRVVIVNGALYASKGGPAPYGRVGEKLNYAMDAAGNFYVFDQTGHPDLRHSSFFAGAPIACAGNLDVKDGKIAHIDSNSGHYSPTAKMFQNVLAELKKDGVDVAGFSGS